MVDINIVFAETVSLPHLVLASFKDAQMLTGRQISGYPGMFQAHPDKHNRTLCPIYYYRPL
jgi:hypothetical protein